MLVYEARKGDVQEIATSAVPSVNVAGICPSAYTEREVPVIDTTKVTELSAVGVALIEEQLLLASITAEDALRDIWALGYCFGVFEATLRREDVDPHSIGLLVVTVGFQQLVSDIDAGANQVAVAADCHTDTIFIEGNMRGGSEVFVWLRDKQQFSMGLFQRLTTSRS